MNNHSFFADAPIIAGMAFVVWLLIQINHVIFRRVRKKRTGIEVIFFEKVISVLIVIIGVVFLLSFFGEIQSVWKTILGGTAIASAVIVFVAQDIARDILAGLMISMYKPFELGNRVELDDGQSGIVIDITMRHVVLKIQDTQVLIIPNSKLNTMRIKNVSYHNPFRAREFNFYAAYGSDIDMARRVVQQAVIESKYTVPGIQQPNGMEYAPVYFMSFDDGRLRIMTTVYYPQSVSTEIMITDINLRVNEGFRKYGIEMPYPYINVLQRQWVELVASGEEEKFAKRTPGLPLMKVSPDGKGMHEAIEATAKLGADCGLDRKDVMRLRLLSEELFGMMKNLVGNVEGNYWVWQEKKKFAIHLHAYVPMNRDLRRQLLSVSSSGRNEAATGFMGRLRDLIDVMTLPTEGGDGQENPGILGKGFYGAGTSGTGFSGYSWSMSKYKSEVQSSRSGSSEAGEAWDELEKSIVAKLADDVRINVKGSAVEIKIYKKF